MPSLFVFRFHSIAYVAYISDANHPPKANAGGDKIVTLPISLVILDGRKSSDDRGIISYLWTRDDKSLAVGVSTVKIYVTL